MPPTRSTSPSALPDEADLVRRLGRADESALEQIMRHHNGSLFRVARAILKDDADAQDALQDAYLSAFRHIGDFRAESKLSTWLTRIVVNQALARRRTRVRDQVIVQFGAQRPDEHLDEGRGAFDEPPDNPEQSATRADIRRVLEEKIDALPVAFRTVFVLREVEGLSVDETAACLEIPAATVRTRLFRARGLLREALARELDLAAADVFTFGGTRCDRVVAAVLLRYRAGEATPSVATLPPSPLA